MDRVSIEEAAEMLGCSKHFVRLGIQRGSLPIGSCEKMSSRYTYVIPRERLMAFMEGRDIKIPTAATVGIAKTNNVKAERIW